MAKIKTDFFNPPEIIIREEDSGAITVEGWAEDIEKHKEQIKAVVKKHFQKKYSEPLS